MSMMRAEIIGQVGEQYARAVVEQSDVFEAITQQRCLGRVAAAE
jgi:hypothetical protein